MNDGATVNSAMTRLLPWVANEVNRRTFLRRAIVGALGALTGLSVGIPDAYAGSCTGPYGTGYCGSTLCDGARCGSSYYGSCSPVNFCLGGSCWTSGSHTCCDCLCHVCSAGCRSFYCYCHG